MNNRRAASQGQEPTNGRSQGDRSPPPNSVPAPVLHSIPNPWKAGERSAPIQLGPSPAQPHHRTILAILNRISDVNIEVTVRRGTELLHPPELAPGMPSLAALREDLVSMLFEKALDEDKYLKDYAAFLKGVSSNITNLPPVKICETGQELPQHPNSRELLLPLEEFVRLKCIGKFEDLYDSLRTMYSGIDPWDCQKDQHTRRKLVSLLKFMVLLFHKTMLPWSELLSVRDTFARPLEASIGVSNVHLGAEDEALVFQDLGVASSDGISLNALASEMLAVFLQRFGRLNLADKDSTRERSSYLCKVLHRIVRMNQLNTRQRFVVINTLELKAKGWVQQDSDDFLSYEGDEMLYIVFV